MLSTTIATIHNQPDERALSSATPLPISSDNDDDINIIESINFDSSPAMKTAPVSSSSNSTIHTFSRGSKKRSAPIEENMSGEFCSLKNTIQNLNNEIKLLKEQLAEAHNNNFIQNRNTNKNLRTNENDTTNSILSNNSFEYLTQENEHEMHFEQNDIEKNETPFELIKKQIKTRNKVSKPNNSSNSSTTKQAINNINNINSNKNNNDNKKNSLITSNNNNNNNDNNNINKTASPSTTTADEIVTVPTKSTKRPPPLHVYGQDIKNTVTLAKGINIKNFLVKRINSNKHTITTDTLENFNAIKTVFDEVHTKFYTYTPKELKPKSLVLRGLNDNENLDELKADIETDNIKIVKIIQMRARRTDNYKKLLPLYIVQFTPDTLLNSVYNIKTINYQKITWQQLNKADGIIQCKNCQRFGHTASNCSLAFRCVKCANEHLPGECTINDDIPKVDIFCINCKQSGHPASYKGCPLYQSLLVKLKKRIEDKKRQQQTAKSTPKMFDSVKVSKENGTFAEMMRGGPALPKTQQQQQQTQQQQHFNETTIINLNARIDKMAKIMDAQSEQISQLLQIFASL